MSGLTPTTETTPVTSGSCRIAVRDELLQPLHLGEGDFGAGFGHGGDQAGVLQRQEALRHDDVEPDGRQQGDEGHEQREPLMAQHPFEAAAVERDAALDQAVEPARHAVAAAPCSWRSSLAHIIGVSVSDTIIDTTTAMVSVSANSRNMRPTSPVMNSSGMNTAISETVSEMMVKPISRAPRSAA